MTNNPRRLPVAGSAAPRSSVAASAAPRSSVVVSAAPRDSAAASAAPRSSVAASAAPRSTLELLDNVPESLLRRLKQYPGRFATEAVAAMQERLPVFAALGASQRAKIG